MSKTIQYEHGIFAVDADYVRPRLAAIHLVVENGSVAFVDTGCNASLPNALGALEEIDLGVENVRYVILTHIHLDHAGGAGAMMRAFPNAHLVVHPRGARHMADPSRLMAGAADVYGAEEVHRLYGQVLPVDADRIIEATHESCLDLAGRQLVCIDTPGHARHHIGIIDSRSGHAFTGDIFGLSYRELDTNGRQFIFPTTTPIQFDPDAMHASIELILSYRPAAVYLTHFSQVREVEAKAAELHRLIDAHVAVALREKGRAPDSERHARIRNGLDNLLLNETKRFGCQLSSDEILAVFASDLELNAQGLGVWLDTEQPSA